MMSEHWRKKWVTIFCESCRRRGAVYFPRLEEGETWKCDACIADTLPFWKRLKYNKPLPRIHPYSFPSTSVGLDTSKYVTARCEFCGRCITHTIEKLRNSTKWECIKCTNRVKWSTPWIYNEQYVDRGSSEAPVPPEAPVQPEAPAPPVALVKPEPPATENAAIEATSEDNEEDDATSTSSNEFIKIE